ncbi:MAG: 2'-deoxycytidine 5'-triphosphate deaminase [Proteobacteria bacterium]|nr:2'-deoxycytidine 5'-triphosphate deaminase [Pseudomonadota bacterium]
MVEQAVDTPADAVSARHATGVLPSQAIRGLIDDGVITADSPIGEDQIQPASIDLRLGTVAHRVQASFLPGTATVAEKLAQFGLHAFDITGGAVLECGCVYIVPLCESLRLERGLSAIANPKSSTGRLDIFTRLITDRGVEFDRVRGGYDGPLYAEISPRTFSVVVRAGARLNQLRLKSGQFSYSDRAMRQLNRKVGLIDADPQPGNLKDGIPFTVDLQGDPDTGLVGFRARKNTRLIDVDNKGGYDPVEFWEPIYRGRLAAIVLNPDDFYILASREAVTVPPDHAAEMVAYDTLVGEFRVHYAGFFDPGFGDAGSGGGGSRAVLEVRSHDVPFMIEHGQIMGRLVYERLTETPDRVYGQGIGSSYQRQGLQLGKHFTPWPGPGKAGG